MKKTLRLTWHVALKKKRKKVSLEKKVGVTIASKHQERKLFKEEVADTETVDKITVSSSENWARVRRQSR